jgi:hypothetical protein
VALPWLGDLDARRQLLITKRRAPDTPLAGVTSELRDSAQLALNLGVEDLVWLRDSRSNLSNVIRSASERGFLRATAANAERAVQLPPAIRNAIAAACRTRESVPSVAELGVMSGASRKALWRIWRETAPADVTQKTFLDWILLLRAASRKAPERTWRSIAEEFEVEEDTLAHVAKRLIGLRLSELSAASINGLRAEFIGAVLRPLGIRAPRNVFR